MGPPQRRSRRPESRDGNGRLSCTRGADAASRGAFANLTPSGAARKHLLHPWHTAFRRVDGADILSPEPPATTAGHLAHRRTYRPTRQAQKESPRILLSLLSVRRLGSCFPPSVFRTVRTSTPDQLASSSWVKPSRRRAVRIRPKVRPRSGTSPVPRTVSIAGQRVAWGTDSSLSHEATLWYQHPSLSARVCCVSPRSIRRWAAFLELYRCLRTDALGRAHGRAHQERGTAMWTRRDTVPGASLAWTVDSTR